MFCIFGCMLEHVGVVSVHLFDFYVRTRVRARARARAATRTRTSAVDLGNMLLF